MYQSNVIARFEINCDITELEDTGIRCCIQYENKQGS